MDTLDSMRQNTQAQNKAVKWKVEMLFQIDKDIYKEGLYIM